MSFYFETIPFAEKGHNEPIFLIILQKNEALPIDEKE